MIDIHTHILPQIDDGAGSVSEALSMAESMHSDQITQAVCTPHFDPAHRTLEDFIQKRTASINLMEQSKISLITGSETLLHDFLFYYSDIRPLAIGTTDYILIELPYSKKWDKNVYESLEKLILTYDLLPIIAHIERYEAVKKSNKNIVKLMEMGCLLQLNASSVIDEKSRRRVIKYLKQGYIDVIASDCHNLKNRPPNLFKAYEIITQELGNGISDRLKQNAENIVAGVHINKRAYL